MKKPIIYLLIFSICSTSFSDDIFLLSDGKLQVEIPFKETQKALVNDVCLKDLKKCQALQVLNSKTNRSKLEIKKFGHEAAAYCRTVEGIHLNLINKKGEGMSFCAFSDHSIISSWDLYRAHFPDSNKK